MNIDMNLKRTKKSIWKDLEGRKGKKKCIYNLKNNKLGGGGGHL